MPSSPGSVVLVRFPFTHLHATKKRPAVVISPAEYAQRHGDRLVPALTSKPQPETFLALAHWQPAGLLGPTWIKPALFCLSDALIDRRIGSLAREDYPRVTHALRLLIASEYLHGPPPSV